MDVGVCLPSLVIRDVPHFRSIVLYSKK